MKTIMIIGAGKTQVPLIKAAKKEGYHTIVCDLDAKAPGVALADEYFNVSTKDREGLLRTARENRIDGIVANSEYAMCDVAFISTSLGLVGNSEETIEILSSKSGFRSLQKQIGLFSPENVKIEELTFPLIVKPDMNSGTRGTTVIRNEAEREKLKDAFENCANLSRNGKAIIEEYIPILPEKVVEGELFIHKGEILWDGFFRSIRSRMANMIPMTYVFPLVEKNEEKLRVSLEKILCTAKVVHGEYNVEACFVKGEPFIFEINPRQGGNDLPRYVQEHCGIDLYRLLVTTSVGDDNYWESLKKFRRRSSKITHHMLYPRKSGKFRGVQITDEIKKYVSYVKVNIPVGGKVEETKDGSSSIGFVDLIFSDQETQISVSGMLEEQIRIEVDENRTNDGGNGSEI